MLKKLIIFALIAVATLGLTGRDMDISDKSTVVFDLRPLEEFKKERIKNSIHLDYHYFEPQLMQKSYEDFVNFLKISGVKEDSRVFFIINNKDEAKKSAFIGFFMNMLGIKEIYFAASFEELKKRGVPSVTMGRRLELSNLKAPAKTDFASFFIEPSQHIIKQKNTLIFECQPLEGFKIKKAIPLSVDDFFQQDQLKTSPHSFHGKTIYLYPENSVDTYIVAFLLKNYLKLEQVKIIKGDEKKWKKLNLLEKR